MGIPLDLVPVLDLMGGQVVRASGGERSSYRPWQSPLAGSCDPVAVARALRELHPFPALYVADLDAILGRGDNRRLLTRLAAEVAELPLWIDQGLSDSRALRELALPPSARPVLGTESLTGLEPLTAASAQGLRPLLSLDFGREGFLGPPEILRQPHVWPEVVLVMSLDRVGQDGGPDLPRLRELRPLAPDRHWFVAGGVRGPEDLAALSDAGAQGALVASALHDGRLAGQGLFGGPG